MTDSRLLARNTVLNFLGSSAPMLLALVCIPYLIQGLGTERFGVLTVGWVVIGYFGLFDFGVGRALTKFVAEKLGAGAGEELAPLVWTGLVLMFLLGAVGAVVLAAASPWLVEQVLKVPPSLAAETLHTLYLLAFSLPWVISTAGLIGVLEANQSFGIVSALRVPLGTFNYLGPLLVLPFSPGLVPVITVLVVLRLVAWVAHLVACLKVLPVLRRFRVDPGVVGVLARFGGWMTVSNIVSPLMTYMDRFLIGGLISVAAVAYYVTPYELVTKLWLIPSAVLGVLFPAFAATFSRDRAHTAVLFDRGVRAIFLAMFPVTLVVITLAHEGMALWLGEEFARQSDGVLRWLALGVFINCLGHVPFSLVQGIGRPDLTAKLHLLELPLYGAAIWGLSRHFGLEGVAMAWVLRVAVDTTVLFVVARRLFPAGAVLLRGTVQMVLVALAAFGVGVLQDGMGMKVAFLLVILTAFGLVAWWRILSPGERAFVQRRYAAAAGR